jgi:hypothetical protein
VPLINYLVPLALLVALIFAAALQGLAVSGHFPQRRKAAEFGTIVLFGSMALVVLGLVGGIAAALHFVPWYAAIIGGGFALLAAPLVLRWFPDRFVDGRSAPLVFAGASTVFVFLLIWLVADHRCVAVDATQNLSPDHQTLILQRGGYLH